MIILNSPKCGKGLAGISIGMGIEGGVPGAGYTGVSGAAGITSQAAVDINAGAGFGVGGAIYADVCKTTINRCINPCD